MSGKRVLYRLMFLFPLLVASVAAGEAEDTRPPSGVTVVDAPGVAELAARIPSLVVVDSRITADRRQGYIEDSVSLPNTDTNCITLARVIPSRQHPALFYCNGVRCGRSLDAIKKARGCGYHRLYWFRGGFEEWIASGYPFVKE